MERLLTIRDISEIFQVHRRTVHRWINDNLLKSLKLGGSRRFKESDVLSLIKKSEEEARAGQTS